MHSQGRAGRVTAMHVVDEQAAAVDAALKGLPTIKAWLATARDAAPRTTQ